MINLNNLNLSLDDIPVFEDTNFHFGREMYILTGTMRKRKSLLISELADAYLSYNKSISYVAERGIVYLPTTKMLIESLTIKQNLDFFANFFNTSYYKVSEIVHHFELDSILNRKVNSLTSDIKQLVKIACVFLNTDASVYLLDDLFIHLNKHQMDIVKDYFKTIKQTSTIIIAKNNIVGLEEFNPRLVKIENKQLVFEEKNG